LPNHGIGVADQGRRDEEAERSDQDQKPAARRPRIEAGRTPARGPGPVGTHASIAAIGRRRSIWFITGSIGHHGKRRSVCVIANTTVVALTRAGRQHRQADRCHHLPNAHSSRAAQPGEFLISALVQNGQQDNSAAIRLLSRRLAAQQ